jgi:hypothetical protein
MLVIESVVKPVTREAIDIRIKMQFRDMTIHFLLAEISSR